MGKPKEQDKLTKYSEINKIMLEQMEVGSIIIFPAYAFAS